MDTEQLYDHIFKRRSIRKYVAEPLDDATMSAVRAFLRELRPLFPDIMTETMVVDDEEVKGLLRTDAPHFLAFFSEPKEGYQVNAGFMLQQLDLYLSANGIGCCYQGMAKMKGVEGPAGLELVIILSFGRPKDELHRANVADFKRQPLSKISAVEGMNDVMEAARLSPSGINNQPWYFTGGNGLVHAYYSRSLLADGMNRINMGIALCHIWLAVSHSGRTVEFVKDETAEKDAPKGRDYVISVRAT